MKCPECGQGDIRVMETVVCSCNHHPLICDTCFTEFEVPCGEPYDESALPPEFPMEADKTGTEIWHEMFAKHPNGKNRLKELPLLENFKARLEAKP